LKKKLEELNLVDDFLFGAMLSYPEIGEKFARLLLETVFSRKFGKLTIIPQKTYYGGDTDQHGARLDVYIEETGDAEAIAAAYDVESQSIYGKIAKESLPERTRFYHAKIDGASLKAGETYQALKTVVVLMIMPYDPFDRDHMVYTIRRHCEELPDMSYEDRARTIFLYTRGTKGKASQELRQMLRYFEHTVPENAESEPLKKLHRMVDQVKRDKEVSTEFMLWAEREMLWKEAGREEERKNTEAERQRAEAACQRAEAACQRENAERQKAEAEHQRAEAALAEVEALKRQLKQLQGVSK